MPKIRMSLYMVKNHLPELTVYLYYKQMMTLFCFRLIIASKFKNLRHSTHNL